jgi:hypothetical protein
MIIFLNCEFLFLFLFVSGVKIIKLEETALMKTHVGNSVLICLFKADIQFTS